MLQCVAVCSSVLQCVALRCSVLTKEIITGWRRLIGCHKLQVIFRKRATNFRALLRKMTNENKASYDSTPPCTRRISLKSPSILSSLDLTATHCITLQHTASHCITLHHTATHYNTLQHAVTHYNTLQHAVDSHSPRL